MNKKIYKIPPVLSYDIEGMENWLSDMALDGWLLSEDGIKLGVAVFEKAEPTKMRYCLVGSKNGTRAIHENDGEPEYEEIKHIKEYGWEYIAKRDGFHIYRSEDPEARELNTDPEVQALALKAVANRQGMLPALALVWLALHPLAKARFNIFEVSFQVSSWLFLLWFIAAIWILAGIIARCVHLGKLRRRLRQTGSISKGKNRREMRGAVILRSVLNVLMVIIFLFGSGVIYCRNHLQRDNLPLSKFQGEPPFATIADFVPGDEYISAYRSNGNCFSLWSDLISPVCITWDEGATVYLEDGGAYSCWFVAEYYETRADWIAKAIAKESYSDVRWDRRFETFDVDIPDTDFAAAYYNEVGCPVIIIQNGSKVLCCRIMELGIPENEPDYYVEISGEEYAKIVSGKFLK